MAAPVGRWAQVSELTVWMLGPKLAGSIYSGFVSSAELLRTLAPLAFHRAFDRPFRAIVDVSAVTGVDVSLFPFLVEHTREMALTKGLIDRAACIRPKGVTGAVASGVFHDYLGANMDFRFVDSFDEAVAYVEAEPHRAEIEAMIRATAESSVIVSLRRLLLEDPRRTLDAVARSLGVSTRTLQRACLDSETTFRDEVANARFAFSEQLLRVTDDKIDAIARRAGYSSSAAFARRFQQVHGITPTQFRAKR